MTPHLGGSTVEAQEQVAEDAAQQIVDVLQDRPTSYAVNAPIIPPQDLEFLVPYIDLAERMGRFTLQLTGGDGIFTTSHITLSRIGLEADRNGIIKTQTAL